MHGEPTTSLRFLQAATALAEQRAARLGNSCAQTPRPLLIPDEAAFHMPRTGRRPVTKLLCRPPSDATGTVTGWISST
ncbi:hypothetical protein [Streptomyces sp. NPDC052701]|uniref:hypothetical protein n=1 Tax=Streptomyces sp. NPDC052701 TaxID=3155533 RepID=UPI00342A22BB